MTNPSLTIKDTSAQTGCGITATGIGGSVVCDSGKGILAIEGGELADTSDQFATIFFVNNNDDGDDTFAMTGGTISATGAAAPAIFLSIDGVNSNSGGLIYSVKEAALYYNGYCYRERPHAFCLRLIANSKPEYLEPADGFTEAYLEYLITILRFIGGNSADAQAVYDLEKEIATASLDPQDNQNVDKYYNPYNKSDLAKLFTGFDFDKALVLTK